MAEPARTKRPQRPRGKRRPGAGDPAPAVSPAAPAGATADDHAAALDFLAAGELEIEGRLVAASNATLFCTVRHQGREAKCVYKPVAGERPLWDFPPGTLADREVAAYAVSRAAGWDLVPPTLMRDGPYGPGMCQLWIDADPATDLVALARSADHPQLREMAVFDAVVNNADRKIGHLLPLPGGRLYGCDHGVCFGEEYKLRTVLWQWRGLELPGSSVAALDRLDEQITGGDLGRELADRLSAPELLATRKRIELLRRHRVHPYPPENWPAVPWPPV
ncbi:MAG: SCO1664 family protein [Gemmatimonadota bacterium]